MITNKTDQKAKYVSAVWEISQTIQNTPSLDEALTYSLDKVARTIEVETGTIWYYDREKTNRILPVYILNQTMPSNVMLHKGEGIAGAVIENGQSEVILDCHADSRWAGRVDAKTGFVTRNMICVPLKTQYETIGCIQLINKQNADTFGIQDLKLAENLASLVAIAIDRKGLLVNHDDTKKVLVSLNQVKKEFTSGNSVLPILNGITLDIYEHEFVVILGVSGSGKTTLLNLIGGMDSMTSGSIVSGGLDFNQMKQAQLVKYRQKDVGFVFQAYHLMPNLTARENLELIADRNPQSMDVMEALKMVAVDDRADNYPSQLSGGQQQRVSIARAIVKQPKLILADEPTAALDYHTSLDVLEVFEDIIQKKVSTLILITHNPEIAKMANRVIKISDGKISDITVNRHPAKARELKW